MITYVIIFTIALSLSLILTPLVKRLSYKIKALDIPNERKVHDTQIPRLGGIAVYLSFMAVFYGAIFYFWESKGLFADKIILLRGFALGSLVIVILGVADDIIGLRPLFKLLLQLVAGIIVYAHGLQIKMVELPFFGELNLGFLSFPFTLIWIAGITNALNLIDGLDGLAAGVTFIASMILFLVSLSQGNTETALFSAVLGGCVVGFLKYNFNPAQIFLGDSGALFLGFSLANFSVLGAMKSSTAVALLIPIIALGFPIMDTLLAILRRTFRAIQNGEGLSALRKIGDADKEHVHHKLMELGYTHRGAVLILYTLCLIFGIFAFILTAYRNEVAGAILFFVGLIVFVFVRTLGYLEFRGLKEGNFLEQYLSRLKGRQLPPSQDKDTSRRKE
jgi:UDP-GlcNAc:undecaprenyl-phosphate GlcNAc-1-phosphate transferase